MRKKINILLVTGGTLFFSYSMYAQNTTPAKPIESKVVEVTRDYERTVRDASRIPVSLKINDTIDSFVSSFRYKVAPIPMPVFSFTRNLEAAAIEEPAYPPAKNFGYARLGFGYPVVPLGDLYLHYGTTRSRVNLYYNHRSFWANTPLVREQPEGYLLPKKISGHNMQNDLGLLLEQWIKNVKLHASVEYKHRYLLFHGHDTAYLSYLADNHPTYVNSINDDAGYIRGLLKQSYHIFNAEIGITSKNRRDKFSYNLNFTFGYAGDKAIAGDSVPKVFRSYSSIPVNEYIGGLHGKISQTFERTHSGSVAFKAIIYNKGNVPRLSDGLFMVTPSYEYQKDGIRVSLGLNIESIYKSYDDKPERDAGKLSLGVYPNISFTGRLADLFTIYLDMNGQTTVNTYQKIALENPYILPGLTVEHTRTPFNAVIGGRGRIFDLVGYNVFGAYTYVDSMYFYVNSTKALKHVSDEYPASGYLHNNFEVVYHKTNLFTIGADIDYENANFGAIFRGRYYFYSFGNDDTPVPFQAWHKPGWEINCDLRYAYDAFTFQLGCYARGKALALYQRPGELSTTELKPYADFSLQAEYRINKWLTGFVYGNNLLHQKYQNYYLYYHSGFSAGIGASATF